MASAAHRVIRRPVLLQVPAMVVTAMGSSSARALRRTKIGAAVRDLVTRYGSQYPRGQEFLKRLDQIESTRAWGLEPLRQDARYAERQQAVRKRRDAIRNGQKVFEQQSEMEPAVSGARA